MLAIREDPLRTELLGYDIRARQLARLCPGRAFSPASRACSTCSGATTSRRTQVGLLQAAAAGHLGRGRRARQPACGRHLDLSR